MNLLLKQCFHFIVNIYLLLLGLKMSLQSVWHFFLLIFFFSRSIKFGQRSHCSTRCSHEGADCSLKSFYYVCIQTIALLFHFVNANDTDL